MRSWRRHIAQEHNLHNAYDDHDDNHSDKEISRRSENDGGFPHAAQVSQGQQQNNRHRNDYFIRMQRRNADVMAAVPALTLTATVRI